MDEKSKIGEGADREESRKAQIERENSLKKALMTSLFPCPTRWQTAIYLFFIRRFCIAKRNSANPAKTAKLSAQVFF